MSKMKLNRRTDAKQQEAITSGVIRETVGMSYPASSNKCVSSSRCNPANQLRITSISCTVMIT